MAKRKNRKVTVKKTQRTKGSATANRNYKDTVFRKLFSDKVNLLSLYNAINGTSYEDPAELEIVTLENAIYMGMKNDLAFIIDTGLFLYEHQSTYNPNMPLRDLFYISSEYQELVDNKSLYSSTLQKIPEPNFIVFYNGTEKREDRWENYLSEAYENSDGEPNLELKVITLNINEGHNRELMEQCRILREYAQYVAKVRDYVKHMELNEAVERAVNECIQEGILSDFLQRNKVRVIAMSIFEYDKEKEEKKLRKAEYESGITAGEAKKAKEIAESLLKAGVSLKKVSEIIQISESDIQGWFGESINDLEVSSMSIFEYDKEKEEKKLRKAEYEGGYESGITAGEAKKAKEIILLMYNSGERIDKIAQYTGYSVDEVENIINSLCVGS